VLAEFGLVDAHLVDRRPTRAKAFPGGAQAVMLPLVPANLRSLQALTMKVWSFSGRYETGRRLLRAGIERRARITHAGVVLRRPRAGVWASDHHGVLAEMEVSP